MQAKKKFEWSNKYCVGLTKVTHIVIKAGGVLKISCGIALEFLNTQNVLRVRNWVRHAVIVLGNDQVLIKNIINIFYFFEKHWKECDFHLDHITVVGCLSSIVFKNSCFNFLTKFVFVYNENRLATVRGESSSRSFSCEWRDELLKNL